MIEKAIIAINPNASFSSGENIERIRWHDGNPLNITKEQIQAKIEELQADYDSKQYQRDRKYPDLGEQFDLLFKDINEGTLDKTGGFYTAIKAVKDAHPKPSE